MEKINIQKFNEDRFETAIALGNFDGVHVGHKKLILNMVEAAKDLGLKESVLLFNNHTRGTINGKAPMCLTSNAQKEEILKNLGVQTIYTIDFNESLMKLQPEEFVRNILVDKLNTKLVVVGFDYRFGHKASGDVETLKELGNQYGFKVIVLEPIYIENIIVSSSRIRELIAEGNLELANTMLGRNYQIMGNVISGNKVGRTLGFPTANLELNSNYIVPKHGVYRTKTIVDHRTYLSATSVGYNPTFINDHVKIECHIIDFDKEIYDEIITIDFIEYLRGEIKFDNTQDLMDQIDIDIKTVISRH